jgi:hypothetical protein
VGEEMIMLAKSMETAIYSLKDIILGSYQSAPCPEGLKIEAQAMEAIKKDEGFSDGDIKDAALVIENHPSVANMYLSIKSKGARKLFLLHYMKKLRKKRLAITVQ